jgi:hypothetical protein
MQTRFRIPLLAAALVLILASCSKTNKQGKPVPKDAAVVVLFDAASLSSKLPWSEIKQNALFQQMYSDSSLPGFVKNVLDDPDNSGIDTKADLAFFMQKDSLGGIIAFTGTVKDAEKFRLFSLGILDGGNPSDIDGVNFISKAPVCVGWNKEKFLFINSSFGMGRDLLTTCKNLFNLKESNSLGEDEKFTALVKKTGDVHFWMNAQQLNKTGIGGMANSPLAMLNMNKLLEGSITTATLNFENGKISIDAKSYAGKELSELYKKYGGKNIDEDMLKRLPQKEVAAVFAMSFKPEGIKEFLKLLGVDGWANMGMAQVGFSLDDFIKANKGDLLLAISDFKKPTSDTTMVDTANSPSRPMRHTNLFPFSADVLFATSIGDKDAFNMLIKTGEKFGDKIPAGFPIVYNSNDKYFGIGNSKDNIDRFIAGGNNNNFDFISKISGNPFGGYINIQYLMKTFGSDIKDSSARIAFDASLKMWDNVYIKGGKYEDGGMNHSVEINLIDKNTNSLKQINQYIGVLGKLKMESHKRDRRHMDAMMEDIIRDSATVKPPSSK